MVEAVLLTARSEGVVLDPVYTGKATSGLIDLIRKGRFSERDVVVLLHTGGIPGLLADTQIETFQPVEPRGGKGQAEKHRLSARRHRVVLAVCMVMVAHDP